MGIHLLFVEHLIDFFVDSQFSSAFILFNFLFRIKSVNPSLEKIDFSFSYQLHFIVLAYSYIYFTVQSSCVGSPKYYPYFEVLLIQL
jgi:hypothetical protein